MEIEESLVDEYDELMDVSDVDILLESGDEIPYTGGSNNGVDNDKIPYTGGSNSGVDNDKQIRGTTRGSVY